LQCNIKWGRQSREGILVIDEIKKRCQNQTIEVTAHMLMRFQQRNITYEEIKQAIMNGEVIEEYPDDYPCPSYLILGHTMSGRVLHVVARLSETKLWLITAYQPNPYKWNDTFKTRKE
jgi:hypothetical protein